MADEKATTIDEIREWHKSVMARAQLKGTVWDWFAPWVGTLLAEIERQSVANSDVIVAGNRLYHDAEAVCEALKAWNTAVKPNDLRRKWTAVKLAQLTYLAGKGD